MSTRHPQTQLIHPDYQPIDGFQSINPPVYKASTVFFRSVKAMRAHDWRQENSYGYGLDNTPTTLTLAHQIATLEGGAHALLCPSGLSALAVVNLALLKAGDEVLLPDNIYGPNRDMAAGLLAQYGISSRLYDPLQADQLQFSAQTKLLWLEAAGSITLEFPDLCGLIARAKAANVLCALDNTWGAGLAFNAFALGVDVSVHALTKYPSGGGDVLMGSIVTQNRDLHLTLKAAHRQLGIGVAANDVELVLRSLPTLALRYDAHDRSTQQLAEWLQQQPQVAQVLHPRLPHSAGHGYWQQVCGASGRAAGLLSVVLKCPERAQVDRFCDALRLFKIGYSWGGPVSLVMPYDLDTIRPQGADHIRHGGLGHSSLVRLAIGLEQVEDLQQDLAQALATLDMPTIDGSAIDDAN